MLHEKVKKLRKDYVLLRLVYKAMAAAKPAEEAIEIACASIKAILDGGELVSIDEEVKTAIVSVYNILETANKGLKTESVAALLSENCE